MNDQYITSQIKQLKYVIRHTKNHVKKSQTRAMLFNLRNKLIPTLNNLEREVRINEMLGDTEKIFNRTCVDHYLSFTDNNGNIHEKEIQYQPYMKLLMDNSVGRLKSLDELYLYFAQSKRDSANSLTSVSTTFSEAMIQTPLNQMALLHDIMKNAYGDRNKEWDTNFELNVNKQFNNVKYEYNPNEEPASISGDIKIKISTQKKDFLTNNDKLVESMGYLLIDDSEDRMTSMLDMFDVLNIRIEITGHYNVRENNASVQKTFKSLHEIDLSPMDSKYLIAYTQINGNIQKRIITKALAGNQEFTYSELDIMLYLFSKIKERVPTIVFQHIVDVTHVPLKKDFDMGFDYMSDENIAYGRLWIMSEEVEIIIHYDNPVNVKMGDTIAGKLLEIAKKQLPLHVSRVKEKVSFITKLYISRFNEHQDCVIECPYSEQNGDMPDKEYASMMYDYFRDKSTIKRLDPPLRTKLMDTIEYMRPWFQVCTRFNQQRMLIQKFTEDCMQTIADSYLNNHLNMLRQENRGLPLVIYDIGEKKVLECNYYDYRTDSIITHYQNKYSFLFMRPFIALTCGENERGLFRAYLRRFQYAQSIWNLKWRAQLMRNSIYSSSMNLDHFFFSRMNKAMTFVIRESQEPEGKLRFWYRDFANNAVIDNLTIDELKYENQKFVELSQEVVAHALIKKTFAGEYITFKQLLPYAPKIINSLIYSNPYISISFFLIWLQRINRAVIDKFIAEKRAQNVTEMTEIFDNVEVMNQILQDTCIDLSVESIFGKIQSIDIVSPEYNQVSFQGVDKKFLLSEFIVPERLLDYNQYVKMNNICVVFPWVKDVSQIVVPDVLTDPNEETEHATRNQDIFIKKPTDNPCCFMNSRHDVIIFGYENTNDVIEKANPITILPFDSKCPLWDNIRLSLIDYQNIRINNQQQKWCIHIKKIRGLLRRRFDTIPTVTKPVLDRLEPLVLYLYERYSNSPNENRWYTTYIIDMIYNFFVYKPTDESIVHFMSSVNFLVMNETEILNDIDAEVKIFLDIIQNNMWYSEPRPDFVNDIEWQFNSPLSVRLSQTACLHAMRKISKTYKEICNDLGDNSHGLIYKQNFWFPDIAYLTTFSKPTITQEEFNQYVLDICDLAKTEVKVWVQNILSKSGLVISDLTAKEKGYAIQQAWTLFVKLFLGVTKNAPPAYTNLRERFKSKHILSKTQFNMKYSLMHKLY